MKVIGISGPSCCGKSTFARHLRHVLPNAAILYEDDFYLPDKDIPLDSQGRENWDCPEAFDLEAMRTRIDDLKKSNELPEQGTREDHNNNSGTYLLSDEQVERLRAQSRNMTDPILLVDGLLLFHKGSKVADSFDLKITFPFTYEELKSRRESRSVYATSSGFWQDPPNYFDDLVWPEFLKHCGYLYGPEGTSYHRLSSEAEEQDIWMPGSTIMYDMLQTVIGKLSH